MRSRHHKLLADKRRSTSPLQPVLIIQVPQRRHVREFSGSGGLAAYDQRQPFVALVHRHGHGLRVRQQWDHVHRLREVAPVLLALALADALLLRPRAVRQER